jgi:glyoxylase-like metal-dependent hydrolase (beta-lactamase superfamily II)
LLGLHAALVLGLSCAPAPTTPTVALDAPIAVSESIAARRLSPDAWLLTFRDAGPSANALLIESGEGAVLLDTGPSAAEAARVVAWARDALARPIAAAMVTSADADRVGGASALVDAGIPVYATGRTVELCAARGASFTATPLDEHSLASVAWMFVRIDPQPEALVAYHAATRVLYGGLFVDAADARAPSRDDSDRSGSRAALDLVAASFPDAVVVVPGRGAPGDLSLLAHSRSLIAECHDDADCVVIAEDTQACRCCPCTETRAMARATLEALRAQAPSCDPICDSDTQCPACPTADALAHTPVACDRGECTLARR